MGVGSHAGYFISTNNPITSDIVYAGDSFREWDMGFDFYAPQTFLDNHGRRILIGWLGVPYAEYSNGEVEEGWQHCLSVPRQLSVRYDMENEMWIVCQYPIEEIMYLRKDFELNIECSVLDTKEEYLDIICNDLPNRFRLTVAKEVEFVFNGTEIILSLSDEIGRGRGTRKCLITKVDNLRILVDSSVIEYYINDGEVVFTTRYYKKEKGNHVKFDCGDANIHVYPMNSIVINDMIKP